ncbi:hypothetical protein ABO01nite_29160 [Asaia bogorensis NBRC 16594]|uniref:Uncharacterized protein n=1 Tax=Asaia bogorensis NBRC 16594 TaxID=1231624 RepID=A0AAN4R4X6_9PROT|nr:hypothetical protein ABO01nite_29160 [Asaia bogorensis NBRC 16594]
MRKLIVKILGSLGALVAVWAGAVWWLSAQNANLASDHPASQIAGHLNHISGQFNSDAAILSSISALCVAIAVLIDD